jgi:hypothetical protein
VSRAVVDQPLVTRATAARRTRALQALRTEASALACRQGDPCAPVMDLFRSSQTAIGPVIAALGALAAALREASPGALAPAQVADLTGRLTTACEGWRAARAAVARPIP